MDNYFAYQVKTLMQQENSTMNRRNSRGQFQSYLLVMIICIVQYEIN